ncbi:DUF2155 domain-containing protein [Candidatus Hepatincolaceae symbiont of Richtersius coronifer]
MRLKKTYLFILSIIFIFCFAPLLKAKSLIAHQEAKFELLNKITGKYSSVALLENVPFLFDNKLLVILRKCYKSSQEDEPESIAFIQAIKIDKADNNKTPKAVDTSLIPQDLKELLSPKNNNDLIFSGWLFASSPSLSYLEDQSYDISLINCIVVVENDESVIDAISNINTVTSKVPLSIAN